MLIEPSDLNLTYKVAQEYSIPEKYLFVILDFMSDMIEKGYQQQKKIVDEAYKNMPKDDSITKTSLSFLYYAFSKDVTILIKSNREKIINDHLIKYDSLIESNLQDPKVKNLKFFNKLKIEKLMSCLEIMKQKETLLGLHQKRLRIILNNKIKQQKLQQKNLTQTLDFSALTIDEQIELNDLFEKARGYNIMTDASAYSDRNKIIEDITHEEVITIESPVGQIKKENEHLLNPPAEQKRNINDVQRSLRQKFEEMAKEKLKNAGVKIKE